MTAPTPYLHFAGTAREALTFYQGVFGGELTLHTNADMGREDGDGASIGHGILEGPVSLFGADVDPGDTGFAATGLMFALLGVADAATLTEWFRRLAEQGTVVDDLQVRPWGASDGQVRDSYGMLWLIGFEPGE
jgi:PhnB protein